MTDLPKKKLRPFNGVKTTEKFVAFVDILGFGRQILNDFQNTLKIYTDILNSTVIKYLQKDVSLQIYSDSFLLTSEKLGPLIGMCQALQWQTLFNDCLVRGGIGFGKHIEIQKNNDFYVISQALVQAVEVEKNIKFPCVALHNNIVIPQKWWNPHVHPVERGLMFFEGIRLVSPFSIYWGESAMVRVSNLKDDYPEHSEKYDWFLRLYDAAYNNGDPLVPS